MRCHGDDERGCVDLAQQSLVVCAYVRTCDSTDDAAAAAAAAVYRVSLTRPVADSWDEVDTDQYECEL